MTDVSWRRIDRLERRRRTLPRGRSVAAEIGLRINSAAVSLGLTRNRVRPVSDSPT
ncbi:hypothetical protein [Natrinema halophilum]|uniref:hypothetical protein n=1 Tax=Natrinema halophilum TaxID=1699371 RepID=UPI001F33A729|nr:hypothetical protein [Natrinema halophilum]UHQ96164.1 hypothetical protein HYG82_22865 [Natrinema halophilum]